MYLMENDGCITATVAVTLSQDEDYHSVKWNTKELLRNGEYDYRY